MCIRREKLSDPTARLFFWEVLVFQQCLHCSMKDIIRYNNVPQGPLRTDLRTIGFWSETFFKSSQLSL